MILIFYKKLISGIILLSIMANGWLYFKIKIICLSFFI